jgi:hypothetical protein
MELLSRTDGLEGRKTMTPTHTGTSYAQLNAVLDQARQSAGNEIPVTDAQLLALQRRWTTALAARLDEAIETTRPGDEATVVARAWRALACDLGALRAVLDAYEPHSPALADALRLEYRVLAMGAGLAGPDTPREHAVRAGRELRERIRPSAAGSARQLERAS